MFADLEAYANAAVLNQLANVRVLIGGATVPGIFRHPSSVAALGVGAADTSPAVTVDSNAVMDKPVGQVIQIAGRAYDIAASSPDGTGLTKLTLECIE